MILVVMQVRALGDPEDMAARYYDEGADEIAFLNITAFRLVVVVTVRHIISSNFVAYM
jgi:imidazole glycerol phosphate synthase subunit HisF